MLDFIQYYTNPYEDDINFDLMNKNYDDDLIKYIVECAESLEILPYIHFDGYDFSDREHEIDWNSYNRSRGKANQDKKFIDIMETRCGELRLHFTLTCRGEKSETMETVRLTKKLLIPLQDEDGYFTLKGMRYMLLYQLLEASTYVYQQNVTLKSLQAVTLRRTAKKIRDWQKIEYNCPIFDHMIFKKPVPVILFYLAKFGFDGMLSYFHAENAVQLVTIGEMQPNEEMYRRRHPLVHYDSMEELESETSYRFFPISRRLMLRVKTKYFDRYKHIQSIVAMLLENVTNRLTLDEVYDIDYWLLKLDVANTKNAKKAEHLKTSSEKGYNTLIHFGRMMDKTTSRNLKLSMYHKRDAYSIVRWLLMEYDALRKKDNMDMDNKRVRCHEYIASMLTNFFSEKMGRVINLGKKATMKDVINIFKFQGNILLSQLFSSGILPFDDRTSDMDFFNKFKYTAKGPNSLGNKNENNISIRVRGIHPSDIGRKDINVCGNSDPGRSGILTPFCKTHGLYFTRDLEPHQVLRDYYQDMLEEYPDMMSIDVGGEDEFETKEAYDRIADSWERLRMTTYREVRPEDEESVVLIDEQNIPHLIL